MLNFKTANAAVVGAAAVIVSAAMVVSPAQAATLTAGSFTLNTPTVTQSGGNLLLNFSGAVTGAGGLSGFTGTPITSAITLTPTGASTFTSAPVSNFLVGTLGGDPAAVNLLSSTFSGFFNSATDNLIGTFALNFNVTSLGVPQLAGQGAVFSSATFPPFNLASFSAAPVPPSTAVPTPALLPGLIGLGVAALRKRKAEKVKAEV